MNRIRRWTHRNPRAGLALALAVALALLAVAVSRPGLLRAQETDLPSVPVDSVAPDFLEPPPAPLPPGAPDQEELRRRFNVHAGANDVVQVGEDIVIERGQHVLGHVLALGGNVTVRGVVDDDVVALGGDVEIADGAQVRGDAVSVGGAVRKAPTATVLGSAVSVGMVPRGVFRPRVMEALGRGFDVFQRITNLLFWLFFAWIVILIAGARTARVTAFVERDPGPAVGWGLLAAIGVAPATIVVAFAALLLVVTIIGIPVAVLALLGYAVGLVLLVLWGFVAGASTAGAWLVRRLAPRLGSPGTMRHALVGVTAIMLPGIAGDLLQAIGEVLPGFGFLGGLLRVAGGLVACLVLAAGVGAILKTRAGQPAPLPPSYAAAGVASPPIPPSPAPEPPPAT